MIRPIQDNVLGRCLQALVFATCLSCLLHVDCSRPASAKGSGADLTPVPAAAASQFACAEALEIKDAAPLGEPAGTETLMPRANVCCWHPLRPVLQDARLRLLFSDNGLPRPPPA